MALLVDRIREYPHARSAIKHWCHLVSDTSFEELHAFAARLGIPPRGFQGDHYDLPPWLHHRAVALGALEVDTRDLLARMAGPRGERVRARRARRQRAAIEGPPTAWPATPAQLEREQLRLAGLRPSAWTPVDPVTVAGCFVCFPRGESGPGRAGDPAWAAAVAMRGATVVASAVVTGAAAAPYIPGLLALREGSLLEAALRSLQLRPDVVLVDATSRDHPRGAGLALHLGAVADVPTIGVTHRPLLAGGGWPDDEAAGVTSPLLLDGAVVASWLRTRRRVRPLAVHPGWRVDDEPAIAVVLGAVGRARTPEPLRQARRLARSARAGEA